MKLIRTHASSFLKTPTFKTICLLAGLCAADSAFALTTLTVSVNTDNNPGGLGETGDLRNVLNTMNQGLNTTPDDYGIVFSAPMTIQLNGILPVINNSSNAVNITIGNPGATPTVTIDGNGSYSGFFIPIGNVTIQNMVFQNLVAKGGNGGDGISGGGGGLGAGGAIYAPQVFLNGSNPSVTLANVSINNSSAIGGNGGNYFALPASGNEGGGGGGGFGGNGGSITAIGSTGGAGGGGFGGNGGDVTLSTDDIIGGGGGGGGGFGSRATIGILGNLGNGGVDQNTGLDGNGYGVAITAGSGGGGNVGGSNAGGGGGGDAASGSGGGGGGSAGSDGLLGKGSIPPRPHGFPYVVADPAAPSGGNGGDGGGGGGGGVVVVNFSNGVDGEAANGGYGGGGGGGAGTGGFDIDYAVRGGRGGLGGGGGGGGVNQSGSTPAEGGNSLGGGGGAGGGPSNGITAAGGTDIGILGGGTGGSGANSVGVGFGGGGGGGGSGLGGAIFVDSNLNFTLQALSGVSTTFDTANDTTQAGTHGTGSSGATDGSDGSALGNSIFLRSGSSLSLVANASGDLLTLGSQVSFVDDTSFGAGGTSVQVKGNGTVAYNGTTDYQGSVSINNANFKVNGQIASAPIFVCRNIGFSAQRGMLSGIGTLTGSIFANSGTISPDADGTLTLGSLTLNAADGVNGTLGSLVHIDINSGGTSLVAVTGTASLAGTLEINLEAGYAPGQYTLLTSSGITGTFDSVTFSGETPKTFTVAYVPVGAPTSVQLTVGATPVRLQSFGVD